MTSLPDHEPDLLAAEHALGVLNAADRAAAEQRMARDPMFLAEVTDWQARLAPMAQTLAPVEPPAGLWPRIARGLPANDNMGRGGRTWRVAALASMALAAASLAVTFRIANQPPTVIAPTGQVLNARLDTAAGQHLFVAAYDPDRKALIISSLVPPGTDPGHVHQLWLIPADGRPRALGLVPAGGTLKLPMEAGLAQMTGASATLAISVEAPGGSPKPGPTGPVVAKGQLEKT